MECRPDAALAGRGAIHEGELDEHRAVCWEGGGVGQMHGKGGVAGDGGELDVGGLAPVEAARVALHFQTCAHPQPPCRLPPLVQQHAMMSPRCRAQRLSLLLCSPWKVSHADD